MDGILKKRPHILIVGAGFGGVYAARYLARQLGIKGDDSADITVVSRDNYFLFTPLLHEVATGSLSPRSVAEPIVEIFRGTGVYFSQTSIERIDLDKKLVQGGGMSFSYDRLVIASGAETNEYGITGVKEHSIMLKTLPDAIALRRRVISNIKKASATSDAALQKKLLSFVIVGGGPTGVELAAELAEFTDEVAKSYYARALDARMISISLIAASDDLVPQFSPKIRETVRAQLTKRNVEVLLKTAVTEVTSDGISTKEGTDSAFIPAGTVVWVAGVEAQFPEMKGETHAHKSGRLFVDPYLRLEGHTDVFVVGDGAILEMKEGEMPVPQLAQSAIQEAKVAAKNITLSLSSGSSDLTVDTDADDSTLVPFSYHSKGMLISLGSFQAAGDIYGHHFSGAFMWFIWRTTYLFKFNSWRKRFEIVLEWTLNLFSPRDIIEI